MNTDSAVEQTILCISPRSSSFPKKHCRAAPRLLAVRGGVRRQAHYQLIHCGVALRAHQDVRGRASWHAIRELPSTCGSRCSAALRAQRAHERHDGRRLAGARRTLTRAPHALSTEAFLKKSHDAASCDYHQITHCHSLLHRVHMCLKACLDKREELLPGQGGRDGRLLRGVVQALQLAQQRAWQAASRERRVCGRLALRLRVQQLLQQRLGQPGHAAQRLRQYIKLLLLQAVGLVKTGKIFWACRLLKGTLTNQRCLVHFWHCHNYHL